MDDTSGKVVASSDAQQASGPGGCGNVGDGPVGRVAAAINEAWPKDHIVGVCQNPSCIDNSCLVFSADRAQYTVRFNYKNYRGEVAEREVIPLGLFFGA